MRRFLTFGAITLMQGVAIAPVGALAQSVGYGSYDNRDSGTYASPAPPTVGQDGSYPSGQYGYAGPQTYPSQAYPSQAYPTQSYPTQSYPAQSYPAQPRPARPVPPQATSPDTVCTGGRFFDHMTKTCESP
ncbi:hypothetical protein [Gluconacetobacter takamatsuzukensis]|uniref:Uncharacterized protein n=1 Tax=Gluconacetobacter takamatsuzukensis TaxID=1286190 RepID=A0A7W4KFK4_9PROT|nr:hypothetical protein [Gluconacetobacter takamatsuzukensis]MBB2205985.1 hypothetical protein [Gluconacetobacter takamatsuzukensis]